ncbi:LCP family protein [Mycobacterium frederiksbergense]|uniref:LCP family protein n=1 Tax=Mycolicibacterium frederiksbergense TaxID=117567 RepID=UPI0021F2DF5C|nr:LCP family protein [Mycolicibacterium frederiksbergense]MCV7044403.1 LCP family protein [Mycolicibacterium frederiksbergense]
MSDGDNATPDRPDRAPGEDNQWLTRSPRSVPGATPWERAQQSVPPDTATGNHTDGVTVADLIAKLAADQPIGTGRKRRRADPDEDDETPAPESAAEITDPVEPIDAVIFEPASSEDPVRRDPDEPVTEVMHVPSAYAAELPDLAAVRPPRPLHSSHPAPVQHHRARTVGRVAAALIAVCALALTGGAWQWQSMKNNSLNQVSALDPNSRDIVDPNAQFGDENFLIVGTDTRIGQNSEVGAGTTDDAAGARSDTIMLVNIPADRKRVVAVSFPRDLAITPIKCEPWDPETGVYGPITDEESPMYGMDEAWTETKLNSAYAVGGPKCLVKVIQKLSGLSVNRFMAVDFTGFAKMVDALGGVEVCSTTPLEDYELGTVLANPGRQMVDGHTALNYVRARQVTTEVNGDYGRIKRQQLFLSSLLRSLISKEVFFSLSKLNNVVNMFIEDSFVDNIRTKDLVDLGQSVQGVNAGRITFVTVPTTGYADDYGNEQPRVDDMAALFEAIINDDPLPEERNADNTPVPDTHESGSGSTLSADADGELVDAVATEPGAVTVRVSNSTGESGLASNAADVLQQHGFNIDTPDDYPGPLSSTTVFFSPGNEQAAATVASSFDNATIERVTGMGDVVRVVLGSDFSSVTAPSPSGSPVQVHMVRGTSSAPTTELPEDLTVTNAADTTCE